MTDEDVEPFMRKYPPADISPEEFEEFVGELVDSLGNEIEGSRLTLHDRIEGVDGTYEFDGTLRFRWRGLDFLVIIEAKRHKNPIKRELVQTLRQKLLSVGAHKGVMLSTAPYQRGALEFAQVHGIALITVTEGRFTYETKAASPTPTLTREEAAEHFGLPTFVGHAYSAGETSGSTTVTLISSEHPEYFLECLVP